MKQKRIVVIGAGISGLATAFQLQQAGLDVTVLEKNNQPGGAMDSRNIDGYLVDFGPNSGLETSPVIRKLVDDIGLSDEMIYANQEGNKRYILRDNKLNALPTSPPAFFKSKLFSTKAKIRLMKEPFVGKSKDGYYQSISEFVSRRLGQEFLDYAINPFVAGVYAGDPDKLSVKSAFPKLYALEEKYGGLIKGMIKGAKERKKRNEESKQNAKMFSFKNGMQAFPITLAAKINNVKYGCSVNSVEKSENGYSLSYNQDGQDFNLETDMILSTIPAYVAAGLFGELDENVKTHLNEIYYPPVMVYYLGFNKSDILQPLDGFGYLIPKLENKKYLGALWSSVIFNDRAPENLASFTIFIGGARSPELFGGNEEDLLKDVTEDFKKTMGISADPVFKTKRFWNRAIPQYNIGHIEHENYFEKFEKENPGIFLSGNYRGGISVGDCLKNSEIVKDRILKYVS